MGNLVSLDEVKVFMQVTGTQSDALITAYISLIESELEAVLDRNLAIATYTEPLKYLQSTYDQTGNTRLDVGYNSPQLFLKNIPVIAIDALTSGGATVTSTSYSVDFDMGVISADQQFSEPTMTYVAGYTTVTMPPALKQVIELGVTILFNNNTAASSGSGNVKSKSIKDFSVTYGNEQNSFIYSSNLGLVKTYLASSEATLRHYRTVRI